MLTNNIILEESLALPLAIYPYSNKSKIIHWLSKDFGHISTFLSGMKNSKNFIFKEFGYFSTSYLTFEKNKNLNLFQIKDCEIKSLRNDFKYNWKAMQIASYFTYFFYKISPENAVDINLFNFYEKLLDLSLKYSNNPLFIIWCELSLLKKIKEIYPKFESAYLVEIKIQQDLLPHKVVRFVLILFKKTKFILFLLIKKSSLLQNI